MMGDFFHFVRLETFQNRERAVFTNQTIVKEQMTNRRVKKIGNRIAIEIDDEDPTPRNARHLPQDLYSAGIVKMMQRQRLNHIIK